MNKQNVIFQEMEYRPTMGGYEILSFDDYKGYWFYILNLGTHPCCYIELEQDDILHGKEYDEINELGIDCHYGFTYSRKILKTPTYSHVNEYENKWVIGWDYAHLNDWAGYLSEEINLELGNHKWTTEELIQEITEVIDQIVEYNEKED